MTLREGRYDEFPSHSDDPFSFYQWSRDHQPVRFDPALGAWMVSRYQDIVSVTEDPETFSSTMSLPAFDPQVLSVLAEVGPRGRHMIEADPPDHAPMRAIGHRLLNRPRIKAAEQSMAAIAH